MLLRLLLALVPLTLTPAFVWLLAEGYVNLGGGEKDILMAAPWALWSIFFAAAFIVASARRQSLPRSLGRASLWATGILFAIWFVLLLFATDWLGIR